MIYIYKITKELDIGSKETIARLTWKTRIVRFPYLVRTTKWSYDSSKPFSGKINEVNNTFSIKRNRSYLYQVIPSFLVNGEITNRGHKTILTLKFHLGFTSSLFVLYILYPIFHIVKNSFTYGLDSNSLIWIFFPFIFGLFATFEVQNIKEKLFKILELE